MKFDIDALVEEKVQAQLERGESGDWSKAYAEVADEIGRDYLEPEEEDKEGIEMDRKICKYMALSGITDYYEAMTKLSQLDPDLAQTLVRYSNPVSETSDGLPLREIPRPQLRRYGDGFSRSKKSVIEVDGRYHLA